MLTAESDSEDVSSSFQLGITDASAAEETRKERRRHLGSGGTNARKNRKAEGDRAERRVWVSHLGASCLQVGQHLGTDAGDAGLMW